MFLIGYDDNEHKKAKKILIKFFDYYTDKENQYV